MESESKSNEDMVVSGEEDVLVDDSQHKREKAELKTLNA